MTPTLVLAAALGLLGTALVAVALRVRQHDPVRALVAEFEGDATAVLDDYHAQLEEPVVGRLLGPLATRFQTLAARVLPRNAAATARQLLGSAGLSSQVTVEEYLAVRVLAALGGALVAVVVGLQVGGARGVALGVTVAALGALAPRVAVSLARRARVEQVTRELPDALDLLAISVEAGLGFDAALGVVADRSTTVLADEFGHTLREMRLGRSRVEALRSLQRRVDHTDLDGFVLSLVQADALGMPLTRILRTQAAELRRRRRQRVRETAAKLPVKMLFPLVAFIFPALFVVVLGPAMLGILESL